MLIVMRPSSHPIMIMSLSKTIALLRAAQIAWFKFTGWQYGEKSHKLWKAKITYNIGETWRVSSFPFETNSVSHADDVIVVLGSRLLRRAGPDFVTPDGDFPIIFRKSLAQRFDLTPDRTLSPYHQESTSKCRTSRETS